MDLASLLGLLLCFGMCAFGMIQSAGLAHIDRYLDLPSMIITFGGSFFAILMGSTLKDYIGGLKSFTLIFKAPDLDAKSMIQKIIDLSNIARKEGLLSLEEAAGDLDDDFIEDRHKKKISFWEDLGAMGPAWGMIGTLIGLVNMLYEMDDPSAIGPSMAVALITTLYGSLLANWICTPVASKLKTNNSGEIMMKEIMIEGLLSIQAGENPRVIEEKLKSFLSPGDRIMQEGDNGGEENG